MAKSRIPDGRVIAADDEGLASLMSRVASIASSLRPGETPFDYVARGPAIVREHVEHIVSALARADAFDVIELMRMRELPIVLDSFRESLSDGHASAIDLVCIMLLARGHRLAPGSVPTATRPAAAIQDAHERAAELLTLSTFTFLAAAHHDAHGPLTKLAATYASQELAVQFKQYLRINDEINLALFGGTQHDDLLSEHFGFSYTDFLAVREATARIYGERFFAARDALGAVAEEWDRNGRRAQDTARVRTGMQAWRDFMEYPSARATFNLEDIVTRSGVAAERARAVLDLFSASFVEGDAVAAVRQFLAGESSFRKVALVKDSDQNYVGLGRPIGTDCLREIAEEAFKQDQKRWRKYERRRAKASEDLCMARLAQLLGVHTSHTNVKYFRANPGVEVSRLGRDARDITLLAEQTEADGLFLIEDVAICVEVKAKSFSRQARGGHVKRLATDLRDTVGDATAQALRLESLIRTNGGLWLEDRSWLDLSGVREVRSIVVCLDDIGPLATALDELVRAGVVKDERFPWIVTLHDLTVIAAVLERPSEFLLYLRRRTESEVSLKFQSTDELDLFMLFLGGGLYVEPDPDRVSEEFLGVRRPSHGDRHRYRLSALPTRVTTHTDSLDAWMYFEEGSSSTPAAKPRFECDPQILRIVDFLQDGRKPGWFRFAADLLNLSEEGQAGVVSAIERVLADTASDGQAHHAMTTFAGAWGYPSLFIGSKPTHLPFGDASRRLATYALAKKHQLRSDRALIVLFDATGAIRSVRYDNSPPRDDVRLDEAGALLRLIPPEMMARPIPPSARRTTKRLNPKKKPKGRRR